MARLAERKPDDLHPAAKARRHQTWMATRVVDLPAGAALRAEQPGTGAS